MIIKVIITLALFLILLPHNTIGQQQSPIHVPESLNKQRLTALSLTTATLYSSSMLGLYYLWYHDYPKSRFHFYDDNQDWLKMDKAGHVTTAYQLGYYGYQSLRWTGLDENQAVWIGGSFGLLYLSSVEMFDGFSKEWGFSIGDFAANTIGTSLFISQQLLWKEQRISPKFSFSRSKYAQFRPSLLGDNLIEQIVKDYNGQTYWISVNIHSFLKTESKFPDWLNLAFGYGANGMLGPADNPTIVDGIEIPNFKRYSQYYISPDLDLTRIPTNSKFLKITFGLLNFIKIPMPAIEYNKPEGFQFHMMYF